MHEVGHPKWCFRTTQRDTVGRELGEGLFLSETLAREDGKLLDDVSLSDIETALQVPVDIVKSNGMDFIEKLTGERIDE